MLVSRRSQALAFALALSCAALVVAAPFDPPAGDGPWVVRARFQTRAQVDRLAAEKEPWEVHYDQGYLVLEVDRAGWRMLLDLGLEPEVDEARTAEMLRPHVMAGWSTGRHTLFVRGGDAANNWGPVSAVFIDVIVPVELLGFSVE